MAEQRSTVSRRTLLRGTVAAGVATAGALSASALLPARATAGPDGRRVAVLGGGVAGLTAAHELAERGFQVTVYERRALGGKARSIPVPGSGTGGRPELPGEHGFRFFPGFYQHIPDTMRRIPFSGNPNGVWNNLIGVPETRFARLGGDDFRLPLGPKAATSFTPEMFRETVGAVISTTLKMPANEGLYFADRLLVFNSSCDARRLGQWENMSWRDYVGGHARSHEFRALLSRTLTSIMVAAKEEIASVRTIGTMGEQFLGNPFEIGNDGALDRVLNGPTNAVWIKPWVQRLRDLGVRFALGSEVGGLDVRDKRIAAARVVDESGVARTVDADYFVVALSAEQARKLWSPDVLAVRPELAAMDQLYVDWMNGIQFYLRTPADISRGHTAYIDAPWSLTSITQNQLWTRKLTEFGDGDVRDCLSVDISDWNTPGMLYGKPAKECTHEEIAREVWAQIIAHLDDRGTVLRADDLHSWFLDPSISWQADHGRNANADPLLINTAGSWQYRPQAHGALENLFLAGDYVRTNVDLATMEGANESARTAVNALLEVSGSNAEPCRMFSLYRAAELEPLRKIDADRYAAGQPNLFDVAI
ncbi:hydroxysqualene dehydroxylase [Nocardia australiensis]|uniref:hydroxysqualene dehydroxylase n=1 Tax=Nocardia australiensis TaxID=2887191 RepID=UPI001D15C19F|nr:FAD-dependent oxidoreductase [Nocardia australiensis]